MRKSVIVLGAAAAFAVVAGCDALAQTAAPPNQHEVQEGEAVFKRTCAICHSNEAGKNKIGPSLFGVVGRVSGTAAGFNYSAAMKDAHITWTAENLEKYLNDPKAVVPGNKMAFAGVKNADQRKEIIEYLGSLH
jgi:cytochrome c2